MNKKITKLLLFIALTIVIFKFDCLAVEAKQAVYGAFISGIGSDNDLQQSMIGSKVFYQNSSHVNFASYFYDCDTGTGKKSSFLNAMDKAYSGGTSEDLGMFFYSGHGTKAIFKKGFSLTKKNYLPFKTVAKRLAKTKYNRILVVVDCRYSGAFIKQGINSLSDKDKKRFIVYTCSKDNETGLSRLFSVSVYTSLKDNNNYIFCDVNKNGEITYKELFDYIDYLYGNYKRDHNCTATMMSYSASNKTVLFKYKLPKVIMKNNKLTIKAGKSQKLSATGIGFEKNIKWKSSNTKIVTVNSKGKITAKKKGTCTITASIPGAKAKCKITVKADKKKKKTTTGSGKYYSSISKTVTVKQSFQKRLDISTVNGNNYKKCPKLFVKVKIMSIKGTPSRPRQAYWLFHGDCDGMGSLFEGLSTSKLKKGNTLNANIHKTQKLNYDMLGNSFIELELPQGVTEMKLKVTVYTKKGAKKGQIKSMKLVSR